MPPNNQVSVSLLFLSGGLTSYFVYEVLFMLRRVTSLGRTKKGMIMGRIYEGFTDLIFVSASALLYIFLSERLFLGKILFFTAFSYAVGFFIARIIAVTTVRKLFLSVEEILRRRYEEFLAKVNKRRKKAQAKLQRRKDDRRKQRKNMRLRLRLPVRATKRRSQSKEKIRLSL